MSSSTALDPESPSFLDTFERWRIAITSLTAPARPALFRCDASPSASTPSWSDGQSMQPTSTSTTPTSDTTPTPAPVSEPERKRLVKECKRCEKWTDELARESPIIRFLLMHVALLPPSPSETGPTSVPSTLSTSTSTSTSTSSSYPIPITCQPCPPTLAGGFSPTLGILLCQNRFMSKAHLQDALAHELIHAYDERRFEMGKAEDWGKDLRKHACTEIRAENLSGDCRFSREFTRRNWTLTKQHQACVRRRATLSVAANPYCRDEQEAQKIVNEVWHSCWADTRPFDQIY